MKKLLRTLSVFLMFVMGMGLSACSTNKSAGQSSNGNSSDNKIISTTAITEVFGVGQKITAIAIEYNKDIDNSKLSNSAFSVSEKTVTKVYANNAAAKAEKGTNGKYVIIELENDTTPKSGPPDGTSTQAEIKVSVTQAEDIVTTDGTKCTANSNEIVNDKVINLVVDDFKQFEFTDPATGKKIGYNLYIPKNYDKNKSYPMVTFMHDASITGGETKDTLVQGNGATVWASPEEQAKHESFVLAPLYPEQFISDTETTDYLDITVNLINSIVKEYNIDTNRLYATGQSGGGMMSITMNIKYPDLFAASMLVACQWDATKVAPMANDKLWIIVCEGDTKAYPGQSAITAELEKDGAKVSRATWNPESSAAEFATDVSKMTAEGSNINYTVLTGGDHMYTWKVAYNIEGVRDWLFKQVKS